LAGIRGQVVGYRCQEPSQACVGFEVLTTVLMNDVIFWDIPEDANISKPVNVALRMNEKIAKSSDYPLKCIKDFNPYLHGTGGCWIGNLS
jgi:hypothetical protein